MDKRGQGIPGGNLGGKSSFIISLVGLLLILSFLPSLLGFLTSWAFRIIFLIIGAVFLFYSYKQKNSFVMLISIILIAFVVLTWFFAPVLTFVEFLSSIFAKSYNYVLILFASGILLLIFGPVIYKFLGVLLFFTGVIGISETLINFNDIFSFLTPFTKYTSNSAFSVFVLIVGIFCLFIGKKESVFRGAKSFGEAYSKSQYTSIGQQSKLNAIAEKEMQNLISQIHKNANNPNNQSILIGQYNQRLSTYQEQGLLRGWKSI